MYTINPRLLAHVVLRRYSTIWASNRGFTVYQFKNKINRLVGAAAHLVYCL